MSRLTASLLPVVLLVGSLAGVVAVALRPVPGAPLLAWFPPGADAPLAAVRAGGLPVSTGPGGAVLVRGGDDLAARLAAAGAWFIIRADALGGCLLPPGLQEMPR
jgi:hypothetical protein